MVSTIATTGILSFVASLTAILSLITSNTTRRSGFPLSVLIPPIFNSSFCFSLEISNNSFLDKFFDKSLSFKNSSISSNLFIEFEIVFQFVNVPPNHLLFT